MYRRRENLYDKIKQQQLDRLTEDRTDAAKQRKAKEMEDYIAKLDARHRKRTLKAAGSSV